MNNEIIWTPDMLQNVRLPDGATAENVCAKANELLQERVGYILCLARRFPKIAARLPSDAEYSKALLEHIEDYRFYLDRQQPGFLQDVVQLDASFREGDIYTIYGSPTNKAQIAEHLNWQLQRILPDFPDAMEASIAVKSSFDLNDEILEMPWCPWPGEPERKF